MGKLVVHQPNRPKDEMIDCGIYGMYENMHTHEVPTVDGTLVLGPPLEEGSKPLPAPKSRKDSSDPLPAAVHEEAANPEPIPQPQGDATEGGNQ